MYKLRMLYWRLVYRFIHDTGAHLFRDSTGGVPWDDITAGDFLDALARKSNFILRKKR